MNASALRAVARLDPELIIEAMPHAVEQVQSEGSVWAPEVAAVALKQASGSIEEAVFLVRAYRSTLERLYTSRVIDTGEMRVSRRISAAFKDIEGGQILGATPRLQPSPYQLQSERRGKCRRSRCARCH